MYLSSLPANHSDGRVDRQPEFSMDTLLNAADNDREFAIELLDVFLAQTPAQIRAIEQAQALPDFGTIGRIIHSQKATLPVFGLTELAQIGQWTESLINTNKEEKEVMVLVNNYVTMLHAELPAIQSALHFLQNQ